MDALDLLFRRLVLAAHAAGVHTRALDLGEVTETLVPYGAARRDGVIDTNEDYLQLVMRLVAGEKGYVFADELMQDDLRSELNSKNPDLAVLRTYINAKIRLSSERAAEVLAGDTAIDLSPAPATAPAPAPRTTQPRSAVAPAPRTSAGIPTPAALVPQPTPIGGTSVPARPSAGQASAYPQTTTAAMRTICPYCAQQLPDGRPAKFCPSCGLNLLMRRCSGCSAEIESGWKFCVTCGRAAT